MFQNETFPTWITNLSTEIAELYFQGTELEAGDFMFCFGDQIYPISELQCSKNPLLLTYERVSLTMGLRTSK